MTVPAIATLIAVVTVALFQYVRWTMSAKMPHRRAGAVQASNGIATADGQRTATAADRENPALQWTGQSLQRRVPGTLTERPEPSWSTVAGTSLDRENPALQWTGQSLQRRVPGTLTERPEPSWSTVAGVTLRLWLERHHLASQRPSRPRRGFVVLGAFTVSKLIGTAAFLLPAADRARYAEEYRAELWDLARSGAGQLRQLRYAFRQFRNALPMRFTLRSPRRRSAP